MFRKPLAAVVLLLTAVLAGPTLAQSDAPSPSPAGASPVKLLWSAVGGGDGINGAASVGIAHDGNVWVSDDGNDRFAIFSPDGTFLEYWGTSGKQDGQLSLRMPDGPFGGVAFAPDGSFYVNNTGTQRIAHFAADRTFLNAWGGYGISPGQYIEPVAVTVGADGIVYVADDKREVIEWTVPNGNVLGSVPYPELGSLSVDADGYIYRGTTEPTQVLKLDRSGNVLQTFGSTGTGDGQFADWICSTTIDAQGRLFVVGCPPDAPMTDYVQVAPDGTFLARWTPRDTSGAAFPFPSTLALDGKGAAYMTDLVANKLDKYQLLARFAPVLAPSTAP